VAYFSLLFAATLYMYIQSKSFHAGACWWVQQLVRKNDVPMNLQTKPIYVYLL